MAVYKRSYKPYEDRVTRAQSRFLVITRYALETLLSSRLLIGLLVAAYAFPLFALAAIYLHHNLGALTALRLRPDNLIPIDNEFFTIFLSVQGGFAFLLTAYAGPGLISPDLTNNALPLYLSRPITRTEYVLGKMAVLALPLSCVTWIPGLILFLVQSGLAGEGWGWNNAYIAWGLFAGSWIWIALLALLATALSAWVRWRLAASALLFGIFFISAAFSEMVNEVMETKSGYLFNLGHLVGTIWARMMQISPRRTLLGEMFDIRRGDELPLSAACLMLLALAGVCVLLLNKRLRGREVVS
jgi:ABC-2 type transport system permease protein